MCVFWMFFHIYMHDLHILSMDWMGWGQLTLVPITFLLSLCLSGFQINTLKLSVLVWVRWEAPYGLRHLNNWSPIAGLTLVMFVTSGGFESWKCPITSSFFLMLEVQDVNPQLPAPATMPSWRCIIVMEKIANIEVGTKESATSMTWLTMLLLGGIFWCFITTMRSIWYMKLLYFYDSVILSLGRWNHPGWNCLCNVTYLLFAVRT